jgi:hypothetical protein
MNTFVFIGSKDDTALRNVTSQDESRSPSVIIITISFQTIIAWKQTHALMYSGVGIFVSTRDVPV